MTYRNHYGDKIIAEWLSEGEQLQLESVLQFGLSVTASSSTNEISSISFMGGPIVRIGDDLGTWYPDLKSYIVEKIELLENVKLTVIKSNTTNESTNQKTK